MAHTKRGFFRSFVDKRIAQYMLLDGLLIIALYFLFTTFGEYVKTKSQSLQGFDVQSMMAGAPEQAAAYLSGLKAFLIIFVVGLILLLLFTWLFYSLTQSLIWTDLTHKKFTKKFFVRFAFLQLIFLIPFLILSLIISLFKSLVTSILSLISTAPFMITLSQIIVLSLIIALLLIAFGVYLRFTMMEKIWQSIGEGFALVGKKARPMGIALLQGWALFVIISVVLLVLGYITKSVAVLTIFSIILYLGALAWLRIRFVETINE